MGLSISDHVIMDINPLFPAALDPRPLRYPNLWGRCGFWCDSCASRRYRVELPPGKWVV